MFRAALLFLSVAAFALAQPPEHPAFSGDQVHEIYLQFAQPDWWQQLINNRQQDGHDVPYTEGSLRWGDYAVSSVGVRLKTSSADTDKRPFEIKLNAFTPGQKLGGMASFALKNFENDSTFVREKAYFELAAAAGLNAPRSNFAALHINGKYWGLYGLTEVVDGAFLENHFGVGNHTGDLYEAKPGANLASLGAEQNAKLDAIIDVDSFLTALALDNLTVNLNSYVGTARNYFLYRRPSDSRWVWIPADPSLAFGGFNAGLSLQQLRELPLEWVQATGVGDNLGRPLATKLWEVPAYAARYREIYRDLATRVLDQNSLVERMNTMRDLIRPWVEREEQKLDGPGLEPFLAGRLVSVRAQLDGRIAPALTSRADSLFLVRVAGTTGEPDTAILDGPSNGVPFRVTASPPWLRVTPTEGFLPNRLSVLVDPGSLAPGAYTGEIRISSPEVTNSPLTLPATLVVTARPAIAASPAAVTLTGGRTAQIRVATPTRGVRFIASITDTTCANAFSFAQLATATPAVITVTANGDGVTVPACTAKLVLSSSGYTPFEVPLELTGSNSSHASPPSVTHVLNAASYQDGIAAPGTMLLLRGVHLGPNVLTAARPLNGVWPTDLAGVSITIGGRPAGIVYLQGEQTSVVVPPGLASAMAPLVVTANGISSEPVMIPTGFTAPGIFTPNAAGHGALNPGSTSTTPPGATFVVVLTGVGAGSEAPVTAQIGGQPALVRSATAVATDGLYRVILEVPTGLSPGNPLLQITVGDRVTQPGVTLRVQ